MLISTAVIGMIWRMLRAVSCFIIVTSICYAVWTAGALGVRQTARYGPESDFCGLGLKLVLAIVLWQRWNRRRDPTG